MAKYIVTRTSTWSNEKPIKECEPIKVHRHYSFSKIVSQRVRDKVKQDCERYIEFEDGSASYVKVEDVWACEIPDFCEFVKKYGQIILMKPDNEEGLFVVEIYDDYRE